MPVLKILCLLSLTTLVAGGCSGIGPTDDTSMDPTSDGTSQTAVPLQGYKTYPNGTGVHVGSTQPESWFGLTNTTTSWFMNGFSRHSDGTYWATGWYSVTVGLLPAEAKVLGAQQNGVIKQVQSISTNGSRLTIVLRDVLGNVETLQHSQLVGLKLLLQVPDQLGLTQTTYYLRFTSAENVDSQFGDVAGYQVDFSQDSILGSTWSSYCKGPNGESQRSVFYQGAQWNPLNAARSVGANLITMTCESGSVAKCMRWGYRPWSTARLVSGQDVSLLDYHQACIHMKRASYCGDSKANTIDGTQLIINDPFSPAIHSGPSDFIEARWTPSGATCVQNRRHPEIPFVGCPLPLPSCSSTPASGELLSNSLPAMGTLSSLLD